MANYIRSNVSGGTFFFTARLADRKSDLLTREVARLRAATRATRDRYPFEIEAIVVLPAAIHTIWTLPFDDADFTKRWSFLKRSFSRTLTGPEIRTKSQILRGEKGIWQRRFWEHHIRSRQDMADHVKRIHDAPVVAGFCARPQDWQWSSVHRSLSPQLEKTARSA